MDDAVGRCFFLLLSLALLPGEVAAQCHLCAQKDAPAAAVSRPLNIEIETALDLGRAADTGSGGSIAVDERTGARQVAGLTDLGGFAIKGRVRLTGEPFRHVRVTLPASVRLVSPDGSTADAVDLRTDLPPDPMLDANGTLDFDFGGRLVVQGHAAGDFRGRIPIVADYQ
jgi:hypothetical protein